MILARSLQGGEREEFVDSSLFVFAKAKFSFYFPTVLAVFQSVNPSEVNAL